LDDVAMVRENQAGTGGGIYLEERRTLTLLGSSSITANFATTLGGGIYSLGTVTMADTWTGTVCGNDPDDWPDCTDG
jgi:predicted outer membrane repeat protein